MVTKIAATRKRTVMRRPQKPKTASGKSALRRRMLLSKPVTTSMFSKSKSKSHSKQKGDEISYKWILYTIPNDPAESGRREPKVHPAHKYVKVRSGTMTTSFLPGSVARQVFTNTLGHNPNKYHFMSDMVVVHNPEKSRAEAFFAYKRYNPSSTHTGGSELYTSVKRKAVKRGVHSTAELNSLKWRRLHGNVFLAK